MVSITKDMITKHHDKLGAAHGEAYALKRLLNHRMTNDVTAGYIVTDVERLRKPMQLITDFILKSMGVKSTAVTAIQPIKRSF